MKLLSFAALSFCTLAASLPQQPQQLPFLPSSPASTIFSLFPSLESRLASLPTSHATQLAQHVAQLPQHRLIKLTEDGQIYNLTEGDKSLLVFEGIKFRDVTDDRAISTSVQHQSTYPTKFRHTAEELKPLFAHISIKEMTAFLTKFTGFYTRYYRSPTGKESQKFLLGQLKEIHEKTNKKVNVTITEFEHEWGQNSIIVRFEPVNSTEEKEDKSVVIMSAHQDSTNSLPFLRAPGADDDGSGTTVLLAVFHALLAESYAPATHPLEFHFYSAEEGGMLGSSAVARSYSDAGKKVKGVFHMDVVAFVKKGTERRIGVISDNVDEGLTALMRRLIGEFAEIPAVDTKCGYACSDHSSWAHLSYPSACLSEGRYEDSNTHMHSAQDTIDLDEFEWDHVVQFVRVGLGYAVEVGGLKRV